VYPVAEVAQAVLVAVVRTEDTLLRKHPREVLRPRGGGLIHIARQVHLGQQLVEKEISLRAVPVPQTPVFICKWEGLPAVAARQRTSGAVAPDVCRGTVAAHYMHIFTPALEFLMVNPPGL